MVDFRLPNGTQRLAVMGHTGSGKTHLSTWALSYANFHRQPWVIVDFKYDPFFEEMEDRLPNKIKEIGVNDRPPKKPGLYIIHPKPTPEDMEAFENFLWKVWERGRTGIYVDEAHMMPTRGAFPTLLTQGRSKKIPMIVVTQAPKWVTKFVFSQSDYFAVFHLQDWNDRKRVMEFVPADLSKDLPERHSYWHDVSKRQTLELHPVPGRDTIIDRFRNRLGEGEKWSGFTSLGRQKISSRFL